MPDDPYKYFRVEARDLIDAVSRGALDLEKGGARQDLVGSILRHAHTLKGAARVVKQSRIADLAHAIEGALQPYREGAAVVPRSVVSTILDLVDSVRGKLGEIDAPTVAAPERAGGSTIEDPFETVRVEIEEVEGLLEGLSEVSALVGSLRPEWGALKDPLERNVGELRLRAERLRLVPANGIFADLERAARDAAQSLGKRVDFRAAGGDHRLDAHVLSPLREAMIHVVRNSVAHGIEPEKERSSAGKPPVGRLNVQVERRGARMTWTCRDDGRGIDFEAVRREASRKGLISADDARNLDEDAALGLLLRGGLSTTGEVTAVSGRGIGLDVVRDVVRRLKGELKVRSRPGKGTTVEIGVPLSLTSTPSLVVHADGRAASIPVEEIRQTLRIGDEDIVESPAETSIVFDGRSIPFLHLSEVLSGGTPSRRAGRRWTTLVVCRGERWAAIGVDRVEGVRDVVLKSIPSWAAADPVIAGISVDERGRLRPALDPGSLIEAAHRPNRRPAPKAAPRPPILIVDDSLTTRMLEQSILVSAGYDVDLACSGEEAFDRARARRYGLFIVDVEMPGIDGFEFIARTRGDPELREIPSILVTSRSSAEDRRRGTEMRVGAYIVKSEFDQGHLLSTIRNFIG